MIVVSDTSPLTSVLQIASLEQVLECLEKKADFRLATSLKFRALREVGEHR